MMNKTYVTSDDFHRLVIPKIKGASEAGRAARIFASYGQNLSLDVTNVLLHAVDLGKVDEVLLILERHFDERLKYQHPEIRGTIGHETADVFISICRDTLKLAMNTQGSSS